MLIIFKNSVGLEWIFGIGISRQIFKNENFINFFSILIMKNLTFLTLIISTTFVMGNQNPKIPYFGPGNPRSRRRRPMTVREAMEQSRRGPIPGHRPKPKRKMPKPNIPEILGEGEFSGHEGLEKARFLDHLKSENDVLPRDPRTGSSQNQQKNSNLGPSRTKKFGPIGSRTWRSMDPWFCPLIISKMKPRRNFKLLKFRKRLQHKIKKKLRSRNRKEEESVGVLSVELMFYQKKNFHFMLH